MQATCFSQSTTCNVCHYPRPGVQASESFLHATLYAEGPLLLLSFQPFDVFWVSVLQLFQLQTALRDANIAIYGGERSSKYLSLPKAPSPRHEYGTAALTLELVESMDDAIDHLHANGSGHTECIVTGKFWHLPPKVHASSTP